jgi:hypothetical protein
MEVSGQLHDLTAITPPPGAWDPVTLWIRGLVDPRNGLDVIEKTTFNIISRESNLGP